jgi:hypothetical protein
VLAPTGGTRDIAQCMLRFWAWDLALQQGHFLRHLRELPQRESQRGGPCRMLRCMASWLRSWALHQRPTTGQQATRPVCCCQGADAQAGMRASLLACEVQSVAHTAASSVCAFWKPAFVLHAEWTSSSALLLQFLFLVKNRFEFLQLHSSLAARAVVCVVACTALEVCTVHPLVAQVTVWSPASSFAHTGAAAKAVRPAATMAGLKVRLPSCRAPRVCKTGCALLCMHHTHTSSRRLPLAHAPTPSLSSWQ